MKTRITNSIIDIILIAVALIGADYLMTNTIQSENFWLELGIYLVLYAVVFGSKRGIVNLWNRRRKNYEENE